MSIGVFDASGRKLMPTTNIRKVRKLLRAGKAKICSHRPFAVQLTYDVPDPVLQEMELSCDTGYVHIGISVKTKKHEYLSEERKLLTDEKKRHQEQKRLRNARRNRKRYRKPQSIRAKRSRRKNIRSYAPSLKHKADQHVMLIRRICEIYPVSRIVLEMGQFDTQVLAAVSRGEPVPEGIDYQHGPKYGFDTLREAVFARDKHKCAVCGKTVSKDHVILVIHHIGYRKGDRSNRMSNLVTVCIHCHTSKNHGKGGALWDLKPKGNALPEAAFMNTVKWYILEEVKKLGIETHITYGAVTKRERLDRNMEKSHANDAYCIGSLHPRHRTRTRYYVKRRRNDRKLQKFYDAKYIDIRDGKEKKAAELGCNRTKRRIPRNNSNNERIYRGTKVSKGHFNIRKEYYPFKSGSIVVYDGKEYVCGGQQNLGTSVVLKHFHPDGKNKSVAPSKVKTVRYVNGWDKVTREVYYDKKGGKGKKKDV